ncbi:MAG: T9SS type A sorting domain-containing protein [Candidatus Marinimicrobia bacterium]|nr:T9SS type A sorting domain-containing protein [Candidatus Neomarinimicrobiota bacterium]MCF7828385.1 T9SS type A sorting domain-containing protein [Candidatus Neomarinimicrobiota bacterium]MCF7881021.1 T9SS type A sorting domain-containing protein [Candidatus Neomarinimicrobiota bacterium]
MKGYLTILYVVITCVLTGQVLAQAPSWSVDPEKYEFVMTVTARLEVNNESVLGDGNLISAFIGDECRGVAEATMVNGTPLYFLMVYENIPGSSVTFRGYISDKDTVIDLVDPVTFRSGGAVGSPDDPYRLMGTIPNKLPTISTIADQSINEDLSITGIVVTVRDAETASGDLTVTGSSHNQNLVPDDNISIGGSGAERIVSLSPARNQSGSTRITVTVSDGKDEVSTAFTLTVRPINDPPGTFSLVEPADGSKIIISRDNLDKSLNFRWQAAKDPDSVDLRYHLAYKTGKLDAGITFPETNATTVQLSYASVYDRMRASGVDSIAGTWTITATDGEFTVDAAGTRGLTVIADTTTVGVRYGKPLPTDYHLAQNYPNPFNPSTVIQYDLPEDTHVRLTVWGLAGQQVKTLVNESQQAARQQIRWDGTDEFGSLVSTGVYLYRLEAGGFMKVRRMVLVR